MTAMEAPNPLRLGIVGVGKIARDQHLPSIAASPDFVLAAAASRHGAVEGCPNFDSIEAMLAEWPADRLRIGLHAARRPGQDRARGHRGRQARHDREAAGRDDRGSRRLGATCRRERTSRCSPVGIRAKRPASNSARAWLAGRTVTGAAINWREDIRVWHPGQDWILGPGGFGVFDPGINALSIATEILPYDLMVESGAIVVPENRDSPIAARIAMRLSNDAPVTLDLDFLQTGPQSWDIDVSTETGSLKLTEGGKRLFHRWRGASARR